MAFALPIIVFKSDGAVDRLVCLQPLQKFFVLMNYLILDILVLTFVETANAMLLLKIRIMDLLEWKVLLVEEAYLP